MSHVRRRRPSSGEAAAMGGRSVRKGGGMAVVQVQGLRKLYGGRAVVDGVSFEVAAGEIFGIVGPNGAGKTTTVECIEGLREPDAGKIQVLGLDPQRDARKVRRLLGAQLQQSRLPDRLKVCEAIDLYATFYSDPADPDELLDLLGLSEHRNTRFVKLSGGQQQRLSIALALVGRPQVAVLDELTTGLDPQARRDTWTLIEQVRDRGVSILLVTHGGPLRPGDLPPPGGAAPTSHHPRWAGTPTRRPTGGQPAVRCRRGHAHDRGRRQRLSRYRVPPR
jgi:ABC-type Na+ transport system ATPase subunit NatA